MRHLTRRGNRDALVLMGEVYALWNLAADMAINPLVTRDLPPGALLPGHFWLPAGESAEWYYEALLRRRDTTSWVLRLGGGAQGATGGGREGKAGGGSGGPGPTPGVIDDHGGWLSDEVGDDPWLAEEVIRRAVGRAMARAGRGFRELPGHLRVRIRDCLRRPEVPWPLVLRRLVATTVRCAFRRTWKRESRRFGEDQQGRKPVRRMLLVVAIDTSGSISDEVIRRFIAEVNALVASYPRADVLVLQADAKVQKAIRLRGRPLDSDVVGRGDTDFRPVFAHVGQQRSRPDALIYLTDLYGVFPRRAPAYPVIWVDASREGSVKVPFGKLVRLPRGRSVTA
jgi:predicted metal-dependent peptidase